MAKKQVPPPIRIEAPGVSFIIKSGEDKRDLLRFRPAGTVLDGSEA
jgi:hypothetical protein